MELKVVSLALGFIPQQLKAIWGLCPWWFENLGLSGRVQKEGFQSFGAVGDTRTRYGVSATCVFCLGAADGSRNWAAQYFRGRAKGARKEP